MLGGGGNAAVAADDDTHTPHAWRMFSLLNVYALSELTDHSLYLVSFFLSFTTFRAIGLHTICNCYTLWKVMICKNDFTDSRYLVNYSYTRCHPALDIFDGFVGGFESCLFVQCHHAAEC